MINFFYSHRHLEYVWHSNSCARHSCYEMKMKVLYGVLIQYDTQERHTHVYCLDGYGRVGLKVYHSIIEVEHKCSSSLPPLTHICDVVLIERQRFQS